MLLKLGHLNVNEWTVNNDELRREIVNNLNCDVLGIMELHLAGDNYVYCN